MGVGLHYAQDIYLEPLPTVSAPTKASVSTPSKRKKATEDSSDEELQASNKKMSTTGSSKTTPTKKTSAALVKKKAGTGTGYSGNTREDQTGQQNAAKAQEQKDKTLETLLRDIRVYLPNPFRRGGARSSDTMMHSSVLCHLRRRFNQIACSLLQSDSITDIYHREALFTELMEWLQV